MINNLLQSFILILLLFTMFFGIGFILNMLLKTTWFPILVYLGLAAYFVYWTRGNSYTLVDFVIMLSGLLGAVVRGYTIRTLRIRGYKMF